MEEKAVKNPPPKQTTKEIISKISLKFHQNQLSKFIKGEIKQIEVKEKHMVKLLVKICKVISIEIDKIAKNSIIYNKNFKLCLK